MAGFGERGCMMDLVEHTVEPEEGGPVNTTVLIAGERLTHIDPQLYLTDREPDAEVRSLGVGRFWVGFNPEYDPELIGMIREGISQQLQLGQ